MIDKNGKWWKGENFNDLVEYTKLLYKQDVKRELGKILQPKCSCGNTFFTILYEPDEGVAKRVCSKCKKEMFICDSGDHWDEAVKHSKAKKLKCVECRGMEHEIAVGFDYITEGNSRGEIRWIVVGTRCNKCGLLSSCVDWKIDYEPSKQLEKQV